MAILKQQDIYDVSKGSPVKEITEDLEKFLKVEKQITAANKKLAESFNLIKKSNDGAEAKKLVETTNKLTKSTTELTSVQKQRIAVKKQLNTILAKNITANEKSNQVLVKGKVRLQENNKLLKEQEREALGLVGAYQKLTKKTIEAQKNFKNLAVQFGVNSKQAKAAKDAFEKLDNKLSKVNKASRDGRKDVGRYGTALKGVGSQLVGALGLVGLMTGLVNVVKNAGKIFVDFSKNSSKLASILGKTKGEIEPLTDQAKLLGSTTAFTAGEIIGLQTELAKLGFTTQQIEASTEGILNLAAATGQDLAQSAELAGATLRIFNLDADEMSRVTDVLAKSTTISSLSMEKLATIMPTVGKTAQLAGVSLERTAALAGTLTDRGLDASTAATSLRNIFLELSNKGITWNDAMKQINESTDKNKTAMDLFGKRAASAASIIAETADNTDDLTTALNSSNGAAQEMADTMLDNLAGDLTIAQSAWEGFILSLEDGNGIISKVLRGATQAFTNFLEQISLFNQGSAKTTEGQKKAFGFYEELNKMWKQAESSLKRITDTKERENAAIKFSNVLLQKSALLQGKINTAIANGVPITDDEVRLAQLKVDMYNELIKKTRSYIEPVQLVKKEIEKNTIVTQTNNTTRGRAVNVNKLQNNQIKEQLTLLKLRDQIIAREDDLSDEVIGQTEDIVEDDVNVQAELNDNNRGVELEKEQDWLDARKKIREEFINATIQFASDAFAAEQDEKIAQLEESNEREKDLLKNKLDKGLITESQFKAKTKKLDDKLRNEQAKADKKKALFDIAIATAVAIAKAGFITPAAFAAAGAGLIHAALVAARPTQFEKGEINIQGLRHSEGGINANIEGGESVINRGGTANAPELLTAINKGLITDNNISGLSKNQKDSLTASLLMQGISQNKLMIQALSNAGFAYENNGMIHIIKGNSEVNKFPKINPETSK